MSAGIITAVLFATILVGLFLGTPIAFVLGGTALLFTVALWGTKALFLVAATAWGEMNNWVLICLPLFVLMANVLEYSGVADDLYSAMYRWFGFLPGGLAVGTIIICTIFAAMAGISGVAVVTMGLIALPSMLKHGYDKCLVTGSIMAGGGLGILIPPSAIAIVYAHLAEESIGKLFIGGVLPGLILSFLFIAYVIVRSLLQPQLAPSLPSEERPSLKEKLASLKSLILPIIIVVAVLGSIYTGITTVTEASAIGALGSIMSAVIYRRLTWSRFQQSLIRTLLITSMVMWVLIGAKCFSHVYSALGAPEFLRSIVEGLEINRYLLLALMQAVFFILGMFMDPAGIIMICTPIFVPLIEALGFSRLWFGVLFIVNMEMAYITPPFGFNLFYIKGIAESVAPGVIRIEDIYRSVWPFVVLQGLCLALVISFPQLALWLPGKMR